MFEAYMKTLIKNGGGAWHVIHIQAETEEGINLKRDMYLAKSWGDATAEEYAAQETAVSVRASEVAAQDADESQPDVEKEKLMDHVVTQEDLDANPSLVTEGVQVGETIQLPVDDDAAAGTENGTDDTQAAA